MFDCFNRKINYLRISVTDRCNLRCTYCMPEEGVKMLSHKQILSFDEIVQVVKKAVEMGIEKVRLTGGEPLVRKGIISLVSMISSIEGIKDLSMTTNGILLTQFAKPLAEAGLQRVNISLDTTSPENFRKITRLGEIEKVFEGIRAAKDAGLSPIKINCVIQNNTDEPSAQSVNEFCKENNLEIRYIRQMNLGKGEFWQVKGGDGGNCSTCNRLRLTSDGKIKPCLFNNSEFDIRQLGIENALKSAIYKKPKSGTENHLNGFNNIGG